MESDFIRLQHCFTQQQRAARQHPYPTLAQRQGDLTALAQLLLEYQHPLQQALAADFSHRSKARIKLIALTVHHSRKLSCTNMDHSIHLKRKGAKWPRLLILAVMLAERRLPLPCQRFRTQ